MFLGVLLLVINSYVYSQEIQFSFTISRHQYNTTNDLFNNYLIGNLCLGTPKRCFKMGFSITTYYIWLCQKNIIDRLYDKQISTSFIDLDKRDLFCTQESSLSGGMANETFYINNDNQQQMKFLLTNERPCEKLEIEGEIGLNSLDILHGSPPGLSFLNQIQKSNVKYPNAIGITYKTNNLGLITFGVNKGELLSTNSVSIQTSASSAQYFKSKLSYMAYNDQKVMAETYMLFCFENKPTVLPLVIYEGFKKTIAPLLFYNDSCFEVTDDPNYFYYLCKKQFDKSHFIPLNLIFENNEIFYIDLSDQFMDFGVNDEVLFGIIGTKGVNNQIEIGDIFFRNFDIILERTNHTMILTPKQRITDKQEINGNESKPVLVHIVMLRVMQIISVAFFILFTGYFCITIRNKRRVEGNQYLLR